MRGGRAARTPVGCGGRRVAGAEPTRPSARRPRGAEGCRSSLVREGFVAVRPRCRVVRCPPEEISSTALSSGRGLGTVDRIRGPRRAPDGPYFRPPRERHFGPRRRTTEEDEGCRRSSAQERGFRRSSSFDGRCRSRSTTIPSPASAPSTRGQRPSAERAPEPAAHIPLTPDQILKRAVRPAAVPPARWRAPMPAHRTPCRERRRRTTAKHLSWPRATSRVARAAAASEMASGDWALPRAPFICTAVRPRDDLAQRNAPAEAFPCSRGRTRHFVAVLPRCAICPGAVRAPRAQAPR